MSQTFKYILDFKANTEKFSKDVGGVGGMLKGAAVAAGALFAADKIWDAAKAVAQYAAEISAVKNEVNSLTGLQGDALNAMTGEVKAIAAAYNTDTTSALKAANLVMQQFGASSKEAFDVINAGMSSNANQSGDFLNQVNEYAPHFKEAGLAAGEMVAIMAEGARQGVFNDKTADAIKEGTIRLREMTQSTKDALNAVGLSADQVQADISSGNKSMFDVMQLVSGQLKTLPTQSAAVGMALADIFGGPGEDAVNFIRSLADIDISMENLIAGNNAATRAQMKWTEELAEFNTVGAQVFGGTATLMNNIKAAALNMVNEAIKGIVNMINYFIDLYNESMIFRGAIEYIKLGFEQVWESVKLVFGLIWNSLKTIGNLIKGVFTFDVGAIREALEKGVTGWLDTVKKFGKNSADNYMEAWNQTLNPKKKIELISLSSGAASAAGEEAGKNYAAGFQKGAATGGRVISMKPISPKAAAPITPNLNSITSALSYYNEQLQSADQSNVALVAGIQRTIANLEQQKAAMQQTGLMAMDFSEKTAWAYNEIANQQMKAQEMAQMYSSTLQQGFEQIGQSAIAGLGLAQTGWEGFLSQMLGTVIKLISMLTAQAIANAIVGGTQAGTATGPAAPFTTPVFIATAVAGVLSAFAALPKFAAGGLAYGPTIGMFGEYPGASSNPEVIAPLSKLQSMIGTRGEATVILQPGIDLSGDKLRIFLNRIDQKTAKRTGVRAA